MMHPSRLGAAASIAALGVSLATPALGTASAASSHPLARSVNTAALVKEITALRARGANITTPNDLGTTLGDLLGQLGLGSLVPTSSNPLSGVASVLSTLAATPGVSGTALETTLDSVAATLNSGSASNTDLLGAVSSLQTVAAALPAPLNTLLSGVIGQLASTGSILSNVPGLSSTDASAALTELAGLANLAPGAETPLLPGLAAVLSTIASQPAIAGTPAASLLTGLAGTLATSQVPSSTLATVASLLSSVAPALPAPLNTTTSDLAGLVANAMPASTNTTTTGTTGSPGTNGSPGTTGTTGTTGGSGSSSGSGSNSGTGSTSGSGSTPGTGSTSTTGSVSSMSIPGVSAIEIAATEQFHWGLVRKDTRTGNALTVTLTCVAYTGVKCTDTMKATEVGFHALAKKVTMNAGKTNRYVLKFKAIKKSKAKVKSDAKKTVKKATKRPVIKLAVTSGAYKVAKSFK